MAESTVTIHHLMVNGMRCMLIITKRKEMEWRRSTEIFLRLKISHGCFLRVYQWETREVRYYRQRLTDLDSRPIDEETITGSDPWTVSSYYDVDFLAC